MKRKEGFEWWLHGVFFAYERSGGREEEAGFYWKPDNLFFSPKERPRELKIQYISGLLVKGIMYLIPSAAAVLFCSEGY